MAPPSAPHPSEDLPPGWKSRKDPQSGRIYYYNSKLKITQWEPPTQEEEGEDVPPPPPLPNESGSPAPAPVRRDSFARKRDEERQLYEAMEAALEELVGSLTARIKELFTGGDKSGAVELNIEKKYALQVIEWLRKRKAAGQPVPQHQVARRIVLRTDSNPEVAGNKLRVHVTQWKWLGGARRKEEKLQLKAILPWPRDRDTPLELASEVGVEVPWAADLDCCKSTSLVRAAGKDHLKLTLQLWGEKKSFLRTKMELRGQAEVSLSELVKSSTIRDLDVNLLVEQGATTAGIALTVSAMVRQAWGGASDTQVTEKIVIIDDPEAPARPPRVHVLYQQLLAAPALAPVPTSALQAQGAPPSAHGAPSALETPTLANAGSTGKIYEQARVKMKDGELRQGMSEEDRAACVRNNEEAAALFTSCGSHRNSRNLAQQCRERAKGIRAKLPVQLPAAPSRVTAAAGQAAGTASGASRSKLSAPEEEDTDEIPDDAKTEQDALDVSEVSNAEVLEFEKAECARCIAAGDATRDWQIRLEDVKVRLDDINFQVEGGFLAPKEYLKLCQKDLARFRRLEAECRTAGRAADAHTLAHWARLVARDVEELNAEACHGQPPPAATSAAAAAAAAPARARPAAGTAGAGPSAAGRANLATASKAQDDSAEEDVESIFSHAVLEAEIRECDEQLAKLESTGGWGIDEVQVRRDGLDLRRQSIEDQIECHILSQEAYVAKVKEAIAKEQRCARTCKASGDTNGQLRALRRYKIMVQELKEAGAA